MACTYFDNSSSSEDRAVDRLTAMLCACCEILTKKKIALPTEVPVQGISKIHNISVLSWYEGHLEKDRLRKEREAKIEEQTKLKKSALAKLSKEEKEALGLKDKEIKEPK